jgi:hypothetical protein
MPLDHGWLRLMTVDEVDVPLRLCRLVAVPFTPTGALPAGKPTLLFSDA